MGPSQHAVDDVVVSNKHLRVYTIIFDEDQTDGITPLIYAEDLSRNGAHWNGSLIGKGNGGVLLSDGDCVTISPRIQYRFRCVGPQPQQSAADLTQECEMKYFRKDYIVSARKLGSGAWGQVFMAVKQSSRTQLACKIVDLRKMKTSPRTEVDGCELPAATADVKNQDPTAHVALGAEKKQKRNRFRQQLELHHCEATILAFLGHPNIISIEKVYITDNSIYIFQDLLTGGDLFSFLERRNGKLSDVEAAVIVRQILIALEYLHDRGIVHRDLKPENVLMTSLASGCRVVLTDFGHAKKILDPQTRMKTMAGTEQYTAPEISGTSRHFAGEKGYTKSVDMWSLGCVTVVLLTGGSPFTDQTTNYYCPKLAQRCDLQQLENATEWRSIGRRPKDFVNRLLVLDEDERMSAKDAKNHSWFSNEFHRFDFEEVYRRATKHWKPRTSNTPVIEIIQSDMLKDLPAVLDHSPANRFTPHKPNPLPSKILCEPYDQKNEVSLPQKQRLSGPFDMSKRPKAATKNNGSTANVGVPHATI